MNFWRRKSAVPAAQAVQLRGREQHPFTGLRGFTPQRSGELRLYQAVREAVPVVDAAVCKLIRLSGGVQVFCEDAEMDGKMQQFLERVPVGRGQFGINAFLEQYLDSLLVYGGAVGEMVPAAGNRDLAALGSRIYGLPGVENYHIVSPAADVAANDTVLPVLGTVNVTEET